MKTLIKLSVLWSLLLGQFLMASGALAQEPTRSDPPDWVTAHPIPGEKAIDPASLVGGFRFLLADYQTNIPAQQVFSHNAFRVISSDGVQNMSDIDVEYDPSFQTLQFHMVRLHRDGRIIDNLTDHEIRTYQRESGMDRHLYNGSLTAVINQENVHTGDIIEYSYTLTGFNPIHGNDFFDGLYQKVSFPIQELRYRLIADANRPLHFNFANDAAQPSITELGSLIEYAWSLEDLSAQPFEDNTPAWFDPRPRVGVSSFDKWAQVVDWALPHYQVESADTASLMKLAPELTPADDLEGQIQQAIRFVQDEVRYLGMEQGLGAYRPNQPFGVYQRRFGDCKDKSLLLTALLGNLGLEAHPVLVHTLFGNRLDQRIPSPVAFNHCIVRFTHDGRDIFVDPTRSNQGGDLDHMEGLPYGSGLVIANGVGDLVELPEPPAETIAITYNITVEEINGPARMAIRTTYSGHGADRRRDWFLHSSTDEISRTNLDYYSEAYPGITQVHPVRIIDEGRDRDNILIVEESYRIEDFWTTSETDSNMVFAELIPLEMTDVANVPSSAERTDPYYLGQPLDLSLEMNVEMPEDWPVEPDDVEIKSDAFAYNSEIRGSGNKIDISYRYRRMKESIPPEETQKFILDHGRIWDDLTLYLSHDPGREGFRFSWFAGALAAMAFLVTITAARRIHRRYDPAPKVIRNMAQSIGGWLVLPAIGFFIKPIYVAVDMIWDPTYFNHNTWVAVMQSEGFASFSGFGVVLVYELLGNILYLVFMLLVLVQFLKKRSSLPRLVVIFLIFDVVFRFLDIAGSQLLIDDQWISEVLNEEIRNLGSAFFAALIWIPYFSKSKRVQQTFINRAITTESDLPPEPSQEYADHCREHTLALFRKIQADFPGFEMTVLDHDPNAPAAMVIPEQPGITRRLFMDLQKTRVLNLSIGPVWLTWDPCDRESVRDEYSTTVSGLLTGTYRFVEYRRGPEVVKAEIQRPRNQGWEMVRQWSHSRLISSRGLEEEVIILGHQASP